MRKTGWIIPALMLLACAKPQHPLLSFRMNGNLYTFSKVERAISKVDCKARIYEIAAYHGDMFFKINFSAKDSLSAGTYAMREQASNALPGTATFWYSCKGMSYTARPFTVVVNSYIASRVKGIFYGGTVSDGYFDLILEDDGSR